MFRRALSSRAIIVVATTKCLRRHWNGRGWRARGSKGLAGHATHGGKSEAMESSGHPGREIWAKSKGGDGDGGGARSEEQEAVSWEGSWEGNTNRHGEGRLGNQERVVETRSFDSGKGEWAPVCRMR